MHPLAFCGALGRVARLVAWRAWSRGALGRVARLVAWRAWSRGALGRACPRGAKRISRSAFDASDETLADKCVRGFCLAANQKPMVFFEPDLTCYSLSRATTKGAWPLPRNRLILFPMRTTTVVTGVLLFLLGPLSFILGGMHFKAGSLIASVFGVVLLACGLASTSTKSTKIASHIAVVVAFLGCIGSLIGKGALAIPKWIAALTGKSADPITSISQMLVFLLCGFFVVKSVLWFLGNRASRGAA